MEKLADKNISLLIVEDDQDVSEMLCEVAEGWAAEHGFKLSVEVANDGLAGLNKLHEQSFDGALVDMKMPKLNGVAMIEGLRSSKGPNQFLPMAIISGFPELYMDKLQNKVFENVRMIDKPAKIADIKRALKFILSAAIKNQKNC